MQVTKETRKHTSRDLPNATLGHAKLDIPNFDGDPAFMYEEDHLHLSGVLGPLVALGRDFNHTGAEKGHCHDFGISESGSLYIARRD